MIASRLVESKQTIPHYYLTTEVTMDAVLALRQQLNSRGSSSNTSEQTKISVGDLILKAVARSLKRVPECNSHWMGSHIREFHNVDISVTVSTPGSI